MHVSPTIDLSTMKWGRDCSFDVLRDPNDTALLRVMQNEKMVFAFQFDNINQEDLDALRSSWAESYLKKQEENVQLSFTPVRREKDWKQEIPVIPVDVVPNLEMQSTTTTWQEDGFWASPEMRMSITPRASSGAYVDLLHMGGQTIGGLIFTDQKPTDDVVQKRALELRDRLQIKLPIRVETARIKPTSYYIPATRKD